MQVIY